jgi:hypothetical protein
MIGRRMMAAEPEKISAVAAAGKAAAIRQRAAARWSPIGTAGLHPRHQEVADQRRTADCNSECYHRARHRLPWFRNAERRLIVHRKNMSEIAPIRRQIWQLRSLIIQAECETFAATDRLSAVRVQ